MEELVARLEMDGVSVPPDVHPHDLVIFAQQFYQDAQEMPRHQPSDVALTTRHGVQYIVRPPTMAQMHAPRPESLRDGYAIDAEAQPSREEIEAYRANHPDLDVGDEELRYSRDVSLPDDPHEAQRMRELVDLIRAENVGENDVKTEFKRPNLAVAKVYANMNHPRRAGGKPYSLWSLRTGRHFYSRGLWRLCDPFCEGSTSELARFGVGISLYFKLLKWLFWTFFFMAVITVPQMIINAEGTSVVGAQGSFSLDVMTLGHLASTTFYVQQFANGSEQIGTQDVSGAILVPLTNCGGQLCAYDRSTVAMWYTIMDICAMVLFLLSLRWLHHFEHVEGRQITKHHLTVDEYTVQAITVPPYCTEDSLKQFFEHVAGEPVADVFLIQDNGEILELYVKRGKIINKLWKAAARVHLLKEDHKSDPKGRIIKSDKALERRIKQAVKAYDKLYASFLELNEQRAKTNPGTDTLSAFITFETQQGFLKVMDLYPDSYWARSRQPKELRLDPRKPLKIRQAPPPSTIIWENTHYRWPQRRKRRWLTGLLTFVALAVTTVSVFYAEQQREVLKTEILSDNCPLEDSATPVDAALAALGVQTGNMTSLVSVYNRIQRGDAAVVDVLRSDDVLQECYCSAISYSQAVSALFNQGDPCYPYWSSKAPTFSLTFLITVVISVINMVIEYIIGGMAEYERHHSLVNMELSIARRVFVGITINSGLVLLAVNARFPGAVWVGSGTHTDFDASWYSAVGSQLTLTLVFNIFTGHAFPLTGYFLMQRRLRTHVAYSQRELNEMFLGPQFLLSFQLAHLMMTVFVLLLYSSGMPHMYLIGCATFFVQYWVDKYLFINYYRSPPAYSDKMLKWASNTLFWAVIGHLGFAIWMLSVPGIFWDGTSGGSSTSDVIGSALGLDGDDDDLLHLKERLELNHIIPLYVIFFFFVLIECLSLAFRSVDRVRTFFCYRLTCGIFDDGAIKRRYLNPDYSDALHNGQIRGLPNYNILENPAYMRALGIDVGFAKEHRHVASVHEASAVDLPLL